MYARLTGRWSVSRTPSRPADQASSPPVTFATAPPNGLPVRSAKDLSLWDPSTATWPSLPRSKDSRRHDASQICLHWARESSYFEVITEAILRTEQRSWLPGVQGSRPRRRAGGGRDSGTGVKQGVVRRPLGAAIQCARGRGVTRGLRRPGAGPCFAERRWVLR